MARRKKKKIAINKKQCILITLVVVIIGLVLLISNRKILKKPEYSISLHESSYEIFIGDEYRAGYNIKNATGNDKLKWTTSNSNVATVDETGKIKGISFGDVTITVELVNGSSSSMNLRVNSYPVYLRVKTDITGIKGWYNNQINVFLETLNINDIKYCVSHEEICYPINDYKDKITLKNGIWQLNVSGIDKNGRTISHHEVFKVDLIAPKCNITRVGKLYEDSSTIEVICDEDASGIDKYEWYRDGRRVYLTDKSLTYTKEFYLEGKHKYSVRIYDIAGNFVNYDIDN